MSLPPLLLSYPLPSRLNKSPSSLLQSRGRAPSVLGSAFGGKGEEGGEAAESNEEGAFPLLPFCAKVFKSW
jgi:hypothetical protein